MTSYTDMSSLRDSCWVMNRFFYRYAVPDGTTDMSSPIVSYQYVVPDGTFQNLPVDKTSVNVGKFHRNDISVDNTSVNVSKFRRNDMSVANNISVKKICVI
jgi:hypothetical protein